MRKGFLFLSLTIAAALALAACSQSSPQGGVTTADSSQADSSHDGTREIEIRLTEFAFDPAQIAVSPGETVTFIVINDGAAEHEFELSNAVAVEEHLGDGHSDHGTDEAADHNGDDAVETSEVEVTVAAGETVELEVTFPEDTSTFTEFVCLISGHYEAGMHGQIQYNI